MKGWHRAPRARLGNATGLLAMLLALVAAVTPVTAAASPSPDVGTASPVPAPVATPAPTATPAPIPVAATPSPAATLAPRFPDPFGLHPSPPPPVGLPQIPGAGPLVTPTPTPAPTPLRPIQSRHFPLPATVGWSLLFPTGRWVGPPQATGPVDAEGLPMRRWTDKVLYYTPTNLGLQALRRLEGYRRTGDVAYLDSARKMAEKLRELGVVEGDRVWLPFPYDDKRARMRAPWVNALGQAVALALFSRLHRLEGRPEDLAFADGLFNSLTQLKRPDGPWVSEVDPDGYLWFEHYPDGLRGHVLNAHAYTVLAIRDYWQETRLPEARDLLEAGLTTLRDKGPLFRRPGTWSWYNLRNPAAHANYHLFHIREFRALTSASGDPWFAAFAELLAEDFQWSAVAPWMHAPHKPRSSGTPGFVPSGSPGPAPTPVPGPGPTPAAS